MSNTPVGTGFPELRAQLLRRTGISGSPRRRALARLTDGFLDELAQDAGVNIGGVALVAVGGYGRGELSPHSDLDLMLLHSTETPASYAGMLAERLWYPIWDAKIRLDHSVRSVGGARQVARTHLPTLLGMLDLRHIAGDPDLAGLLHRRVLADWRDDAKDRLPALLESCRERAARSGELAYATVPDLKESRGGLRDLVVLRAVAASWVADCPHQGLEEARSALLDVRDALHLLAGRPTERLQVEDQDPVAATLGLDDRDVLLRHVASLGRTVNHASELTWRRVERAMRAPRGVVTEIGGRLVRRAARTPLADGVVEHEGEAVLARAANPATDPTLVLRVAAGAAQAGLPVSPATVLRLAKATRELPEPWPAAALDAFLALLGSGEPMITVWEELDQAGLIARLLPGWERLRSLPQRDPIHLYTVDRHLMQTAVNAAGLVRRVPRPDVLLLAAIFHDIGKGRQGRPRTAEGGDHADRAGHRHSAADHSVLGAEMVVPWLRRMGLAERDIAVVERLVRHHLLLPDVAARRDPDDPATVSHVADRVGDADTLELLHALTEADARAAGPAAWSSWKAVQVGNLVAQVRRMLGGEPLAAPEPISAVARGLLDAGGVGVVLERDPAGWQVTVVAPDRPGLLAAVAGVLAIHRLAVRGAGISTVRGSAVQVLTVAPDFGDAAPVADALRADLVKTLAGKLDIAARLARRGTSDRAPDRDSQARRRGGPAAGNRSRGVSAPAVVQVVEGASHSATVLQVRAHDSPGLLHTITRTLAGHGATVVSARADTRGADAVDVFYLRAPDGSMLPPARAREIARSVGEALSPADPGTSPN